MNRDMTGLRVLVTAGASGIGLEIARAFVGEGARVFVCDIDDAKLAEVEASHPEIGRTRCDIAERPQVAQLFERALPALGGLDALINNAGIAGPTGRVEEISPEDRDRTLAVNFTGHFNRARLAVPQLRQSSNPCIVNLSSTSQNGGVFLLATGHEHLGAGLERRWRRADAHMMGH